MLQHLKNIPSYKEPHTVKTSLGVILQVLTYNPLTLQNVRKFEEYTILQVLVKC